MSTITFSYLADEYFFYLGAGAADAGHSGLRLSDAYALEVEVFGLGLCGLCLDVGDAGCTGKRYHGCALDVRPVVAEVGVGVEAEFWMGDGDDAVGHLVESLGKVLLEIGDAPVFYGVEVAGEVADVVILGDALCIAVEAAALGSDEYGVGVGGVDEDEGVAVLGEVILEQGASFHGVGVDEAVEAGLVFLLLNLDGPAHVAVVLVPAGEDEAVGEGGVAERYPAAGRGCLGGESEAAVVAALPKVALLAVGWSASEAGTVEGDDSVLEGGGVTVGDDVGNVVTLHIVICALDADVEGVGHVAGELVADEAGVLWLDLNEVGVGGVDDDVAGCCVGVAAEEGEGLGSVGAHHLVDAGRSGAFHHLDLKGVGGGVGIVGGSVDAGSDPSVNESALAERTPFAVLALGGQGEAAVVASLPKVALLACGWSATETGAMESDDAVLEGGGVTVGDDVGNVVALHIVICALDADVEGVGHVGGELVADEAGVLGLDLDEVGVGGVDDDVAGCCVGVAAEEWKSLGGVGAHHLVDARRCGAFHHLDLKGVGGRVGIVGGSVDAGSDPSVDERALAERTPFAVVGCAVHFAHRSCLGRNGAQKRDCTCNCQVDLLHR